MLSPAHPTNAEPRRRARTSRSRQKARCEGCLALFGFGFEWFGFAFESPRLLWIVPSERQKRHGGPVGRRGRNKLVGTIWKSTLEVGLKRNRPAPDVPGSVFGLGVHQKLRSAIISGGGGRHSPAFF